MTLEKKLGRLMIAGFKGKTASPEIKRLIHTYHIGGVILFGRNIGTPEEIRQLTTELQQEAKAAGYTVPLLICIDQENGVVRRLSEGTTIVPGSMLLGATGNPELAYKAGQMTGKELRQLGINWNLAPVADINNNAQNPVIGVRSFGEQAEKVSAFAKASMQGMQAEGVGTTLKHFPGHGDTQVDSHLGLPVIPHDMKRLEEVELVPFKECMAAGADAIMSAHVYFPALEKEPNIPATLSHNVMTKLLRDQLGFEGVITTDCMEMDAIAKGIGTVEGCVRAVKAGVDLVMVSHLHDLQEQAIIALANEVEQGRITKENIDMSIQRIEKLISSYTNWNLVDELATQPLQVGTEDHQQQMALVYQAGVTCVKEEEDVKIKATDHLLVICPDNAYATLVEDPRYASVELGKQLQSLHAATDVMELSEEDYALRQDEILQQAKNYDRIVVAVLNLKGQEHQRDFALRILKQPVPVDVVAIRNPYDIDLLEKAARIYCTYEFTQPAFQVVANSLLGRSQVHGRLPVTI